MRERMLQKARAALGVPVEATRADIKTAYLLLVKRYHPDSVGEDFNALASGETKSVDLQDIRQAKDILINNIQGAD